MVQNENPTRCRDWKFEKVVWHILHIKVIFDKSIYGIICVNVRKELNIWKCCLLPGQMKKCLEWVAKSQFSTNFQHAAVAIRNISKLYNLTKDTAIELVFIKKKSLYYYCPKKQLRTETSELRLKETKMCFFVKTE